MEMKWRIISTGNSRTQSLRVEGAVLIPREAAIWCLNPEHGTYGSACYCVYVVRLKGSVLNASYSGIYSKEEKVQISGF